MDSHKRWSFIADMNFDGTESLFFSVRQTTAGTASAQARVDLRWTGLPAT